MKAIFLDVDGVLNSSRSTLARTGPLRTYPSKYALEELLKIYHEDETIPYGPKYTLETIDPIAVGLVNRLLEKTDAVLVISSSHRGYLLDFGETFKGERHMRRLQLYFAAMGLSREVYDVTPKLHKSRGLEVQAWLDEHPGVSGYVILDDSKEFTPDQSFVWCDPHVGFSSENYYDACRHLGVIESTIIY